MYRQSRASSWRMPPPGLKGVTTLRWTDGTNLGSLQTFPNMRAFPRLRRLQVESLRCAPLDLQAFAGVQPVSQLTSLRLEGLRVMELLATEPPEEDAIASQQAADRATSVGEVLGQLTQLRDLGLTYLRDLRSVALSHLSKLTHLSQLNCDGSPYLICSAAMPYVAQARYLEALHLVSEGPDDEFPVGIWPAPAEAPPPYADLEALALLQLSRLRTLHISYDAEAPNMGLSVRHTLRQTLHNLHIVEE